MGRGQNKPKRQTRARSKRSPAEEKAALARFEDNLYPYKERTSREDPGTVIDRLKRAGLPSSLTKSFLWAYAIGADKPRSDRRERGRIHLELLTRKAQDAPLKEKLASLRGLSPQLGQEKAEAERQISWIQKTGMYDVRRFGVSHLEYLIELQECADHVGDHITDSELSVLSWAAVSAVNPEARRIEPDSLARDISRFRKRNPAFVEEARNLIRALIAHFRPQKL